MCSLMLCSPNYVTFCFKYEIFSEVLIFKVHSKNAGNTGFLMINSKRIQTYCIGLLAVWKAIRLKTRDIYSGIDAVMRLQINSLIKRPYGIMWRL